MIDMIFFSKYIQIDWTHPACDSNDVAFDQQLGPTKVTSSKITTGFTGSGVVALCLQIEFHNSPKNPKRPFWDILGEFPQLAFPSCQRARLADRTDASPF